MAAIKPALLGIESRQKTGELLGVVFPAREVSRVSLPATDFAPNALRFVDRKNGKRSNIGGRHRKVEPNALCFDGLAMGSCLTQGSSHDEVEPFEDGRDFRGRHVHGRGFVHAEFSEQ